MSKKGTIRQDSIMHRVAEAVLTHPKINFTCSELWESLNKDYPHITIGAVSHCLSKTGSPISKLCNKTNNKDGLATIYARISESAMPTIVNPESKIKIKPKKIEPIPDTVTDHQIGQSLILYIDRLRNKIKDMATAIGDMQAKHKSEINVSNMTLKQKENTIEILNTEIKRLKVQKSTSSRTFNMSEIANIK